MNKTCPKCHTVNRPEAKFCLSCNYALSDSGAGPVLCPAGRHPMDPAWSSCPYCSGTQEIINPSAADFANAPTAGMSSRIPPLPNPSARKRPPTEIENQGTSVPPTPPPPPPAPGMVTPQANAGGSGRKKTEYGGSEQSIPTERISPQPAPQTPQAPQSGGRRICAVMVTYTWRNEGQVFPVYEGRNYVGSDPDCEISLTTDRQLSGRHAAIFFRGGNFEISDEKSMNGTFVNNKSVPLTGMPLGNYIVIKTGATIWRFIIIEPEFIHTAS